MNDGTNMKKIQVIIKLEGEIVFSKIVKGKDKGRAISNVLTNLYREDLDSVEAMEIAD